MVFEEYFDKSLGQVITSESQREKLLREHGLIDVRDFHSNEDIDRVARENFQKEREKENAYLDEPMRRALHLADHGYSEEVLLREFEEKLEAAKRESEDKQEREREAERALERERERMRR